MNLIIYGHYLHAGQVGLVTIDKRNADLEITGLNSKAVGHL